MKYKKVDLHIPYKIPKSIQKSINKQCHGKNGYKISYKMPLPREIKEYCDRILLAEKDALDWFKLKETL